MKISTSMTDGLIQFSLPVRFLNVTPPIGCLSEGTVRSINLESMILHESCNMCTIKTTPCYRNPGDAPTISCSTSPYPEYLSGLSGLLFLQRWHSSNSTSCNLKALIKVYSGHLESFISLFKRAPYNKTTIN